MATKARHDPLLPMQSPPRERILQTARDLFRRHGLRGVGVDAIAEAAGTNKMTLYRHFGSKDELIVACLRGVADEFDMIWVRIEAEHPADPMARLHAWVGDVAARVLTDDGGCEMANAAVELTEEGHPARRLIEDCKTAHRNRLVDLCRSAGASEAELLADTLWLLLEGARALRRSMGPQGPSAKFTQMTDAVIKSFT